MPRVGPACAVSKLSGTFDENELELAASPGPRRAGSSIDPTSADKIKKLEAALEQVLVFFTFFLLPSGFWGRSAQHTRDTGSEEPVRGRLSTSRRKLAPQAAGRGERSQLW